jgi:hypothetical protein
VVEAGIGSADLKRRCVRELYPGWYAVSFSGLAFGWFVDLYFDDNCDVKGLIFNCPL